MRNQKHRILYFILRKYREEYKKAFESRETSMTKEEFMEARSRLRDYGKRIWETKKEIKENQRYEAKRVNK